MAESNINFTEGSGKRIHTNDRTISSTLVQDQFVLPAEYPYASYIVLGAGVSCATANDHTLALMAGSSLNVRIRRIRIEQSANASTATSAVFSILRLTTAGSGGSSVTARPFDSADSAAGATAQTLPSSKGTEGVELIRNVIIFRQAVGATTAQVDDFFLWEQMPNMKPIVIPAGTSNGIAIKCLSAVTSATANVTIEFVETNYV